MNVHVGRHWNLLNVLAMYSRGFSCDVATAERTVKGATDGILNVDPS
jgi:hypothetical protein